jgi:phage-related tail fiber protein
MGQNTAGAATDATSGAGATPAQAPKDGDTAAGATPPAGTTPAPATEPATGEDALGDPGKQVLTEARRAAKDAEARAKAAEKQLAELQEAQQSDSEKAISQARREAAAEERARWQARIREAEVRGALRGAGIVNDKFLDLAIAAPTFRELKVDSETGVVEGVATAIEAFKKDYPEAFAKQARPDGEWDGAAGGTGTPKKAASLEDAVNAEIAKQFERR